MKNTKNLTIEHDDLKELALTYNRKYNSVFPIVITDNANIIDDGKHWYYGILVSQSGVIPAFGSNNLPIISGCKQTEVLFNSLASYGNDYQFIGYKILLNS